MATTGTGGTGPLIPGGPKGLRPLWALMQAYHQVADDPVIFADPLAVPIVGLSPTGLATFFDDRPTGPSIRRLYGAARARLTDDIVAESVSKGVEQVVILSAGLETFAYRTELPVRTWEVDSAETQSWKRWRLSEASIPIPDTVRYVAVDPTTTPISAPLHEAGFDPKKPSIFLWFGSIPTSTEAVVLDVLRLVGGLTAAQFAFDYVERPAPVTPEARLANQMMLEVASALGTPIQTFFTSEPMLHQLRESGFTAVEDLSGFAVMARYASVPVTENQIVAMHFVHACH